MSNRAKKFHENVFDEGTLTKLELFRLYVEEWISTYVVNTLPFLRNIVIYDFFCGSGEDSVGNKGSPILICDTIDLALKKLSNSKNINLEVSVFFTDKEAYKIENLKALIAAKNYSNFSIKIECKNFQEAYAEQKKFIKSKEQASLLILDQFGVSDVNADAFKEIVNYPHTDFLMFLSSSYMKRFPDHDNTRNLFPYLTDEDITIFKSTDASLIHKIVLDRVYRPLLSKGQEYYLAPFSIQKKPNVYGVIFGSSHLLGLQKFLKSAWRIDPNDGEADYNVNKDQLRDLELFQGISKSEKMRHFEEELCVFLNSKDNITNLDVLIFGLTSGFSILKIREALNSINVTVVDNIDYAPKKNTFGITDSTYKGDKKIILKIRK